jgi:hypothetical protein
MDAAHKSNRKYPSYTLVELETFVAAGKGNNMMIAEIAARKTGTSVAMVVPQIVGASLIRLQNARRHYASAQGACVHWDMESSGDHPCCYELDDAGRELSAARKAAKSAAFEADPEATRECGDEGPFGCDGRRAD